MVTVFSMLTLLAAAVLAVTGIAINQCDGSAPQTRAPSKSGPHCTKGCPCGNTCIECSLTCHDKKPTCTKGCPCGDACIDWSLTCHR